MAKIELNITFDTKEETLEAVLNGLRSNFVDSLGEAVTEEAVARISKATVDTAKNEAPAEPRLPDDPAPASAPVETPTEATPEPKPTTETVSKTDVRALATALSKAGKKAELRAIFEKFGAQKLSDIQESDYPALKKELEAANA